MIPSPPPRLASLERKRIDISIERNLQTGMSRPCEGTLAKATIRAIPRSGVDLPFRSVNVESLGRRVSALGQGGCHQPHIDCPMSQDDGALARHYRERNARRQADIPAIPAEQLLNLIINGRADFRIAEIDKIWVPTGMLTFREQWRIGCETHKVRVTLQGGEVRRLGDRGSQGGTPLIIEGGPLSQVDLRLGSIVRIVTPKVLPEPVWRFITCSSTMGNRSSSANFQHCHSPHQ